MAAPRWVPLALSDAAVAASRLDPWLAIADACGFADHGGTDAQPDGMTAWAVSVQVDRPAYRPAAMAGLHVCPAHDGSAFFTARATRAAIAALALDPQVQRVQLAAPLVPRRPWPRWAGVPAPSAQAASGSTSADAERPARVLLGVIDDGCPFAHPDLLRADGGLRVLRLWNQEAPGSEAAPTGFDYGTEFTRADLDALRTTAGGSSPRTDTAVAYKAAGLPRLQHSASHGAHVLGLLAGARRWRGAAAGHAWRVDLAAPGTPSREADIAFVQLPQAVLQGVSVPALEFHAYDGLRYLCNLAVDQGYTELVVVLAYEAWVGPHDGSSWFEQALDALLDPERSGPAALGGLNVQLVLPAGNSRERAVHAQVQLNDGRAVLHWHQPPGHEGPTLFELWAPREGPADGSSELSRLEVRITPPGGPASPWLPWGYAASWGSGPGSLASALMHPASPVGAGRRQLAIRVAPTASWGGGAAAPHGTWQLDLRGPPGALQALHARIGRVEPALQAPRRHVQPHFVQRSPDQGTQDRLNTLNGHACGREVQVAGAFLDGDFPYADVPALTLRGTWRRNPLKHDPPGLAPLQGRAAAYSGAGPSEGPRRQPDVSAPVEASVLWPGVIGLGSTAAAVGRFSGTSAAAPLLARYLADQSDKVARPRPSGQAYRVDPALGTWMLRR